MSKVYQFTKDQAFAISGYFNEVPLTTVSLKVALSQFAPDYQAGEITAVAHTGNGFEANGREYPSVPALKQVHEGVLVVDDGGYTFATFPHSNSDGLVQSEGHCTTMDVGGETY